jgi:kynurenine formamidase
VRIVARVVTLGCVAAAGAAGAGVAVARAARAVSRRLVLVPERRQYVRLAGGAAVVALALAAGGAARAELPEGRIVDLTHAFDADTIFWPTEPGFALEKVHDGETAAGHYYAANRFRTAEHGGTHVDAPLHFVRGAPAVDAIPLERLIGPGVVVDVTAAAEADRDYQVRVEDLRAWEERHGRIADGAIVLLRTGFGRLWPDRRRYLGTDERGAAAVAKLSFPGLAPQAAAWLVAERRVKAVGIDTASIDHGRSARFETHVALAAAGVPAFENVAGLDGLPLRGFTVIALPMKIRGGSGAPLRIVAIVPP